MRRLKWLSNVAIATVLGAAAVAPGPAPQARAVTAAPTAGPSQSPREAVETALGNANRQGVQSFVTVLDRSNGSVVASTPNASSQVASESLMKMLLAAYYLRSYGGHDRTPVAVKNRLDFMIRYSDDNTASALFTSSAIPTIAAQYGLPNTSNAWGNPGYWGAARVTANDMAQFMWKASQDPQVGPWLFSALASTASNGSGADAGFNQQFGLNALTGDRGGKQGWGCDSYWTVPSCAVHSVGFTDRYLVAILQLSSGYPDPMRATATFTARQVQAALVRPTDGEFVLDSATGAVFRMAGGAPIYVSTWAVFGGAQPVRVLRPEEFRALPQRPRDGTFIRDARNSSVYQIVGGAPLYVSSWDAFGGPQPNILVDGAAIDNAGSGWPYNTLRFYPEPGTALKAHPSQRTYVVHRKGHVVPTNASPGGSAITVNDAIISLAGSGGAYNHLAAQPPPSEPTAVSAMPGDGTVTVGFAPPVETGDLPVLAYEYSLDGRTWNALRGGAAASPFSVTGLANGTPVQVVIRARTDGGLGGPSQPVIATPSAPVATEFVAVAPIRVYDSRWQMGAATAGLPLGPLVANQPSGRMVSVRDARSGLTGEVMRANAVPASATAVAYNLTATGQTAPGYLSVSPGDADRAPNSSVLNWTEPMQTRANGHISVVDESQRVRIDTGGAGSTHFVLDVVGYYLPQAQQVEPSGVAPPVETAQPSSVDSAEEPTVFVPLSSPVRVYDARWPTTSGVPTGRMSGPQQRLISVKDGRSHLDGSVVQVDAIPPAATAVSFNITATATIGSGHVAVVPGDVEQSPGISTLNWLPETTVANASSVKLGPDGDVRLFTGAAKDAGMLPIIDVTGYFLPVSAVAAQQSGSQFVPVPPLRAYDSRIAGRGSSLGGGAQPGGVGVARTVSAGLDRGVPDGATAVAYNLTVTGNSGSGFMAIGPARRAWSGTSAINWSTPTTVANGAIVGLGPERKVSAFVGGTHSTHVIIDIAGYYVPVSGGSD